MMVNAVLKKDVVVEITPSACVRALARHFCVEDPLYGRGYGVCWQADHDSDGKLAALRRMEDSHNINYYEETRVIHDEKSLRAYELLKELEELVHDNSEAEEHHQ